MDGKDLLSDRTARSMVNIYTYQQASNLCKIQRKRKVGSCLLISDRQV
jgi:hypothetical protein